MLNLRLQLLLLLLLLLLTIHISAVVGDGRVLREDFVIRILTILVQNQLVLDGIIRVELLGLLHRLFMFNLLQHLLLHLAIGTTLIISELFVRQQVLDGLLVGTLETECLQQTLQDLLLRETLQVSLHRFSLLLRLITQNLLKYALLIEAISIPPRWNPVARAHHHPTSTNFCSSTTSSEGDSWSTPTTTKTTPAHALVEFRSST